MLLLVILLAGCASTGKGPVVLFPVLDEKTPEIKKIGYEPHGRYWSFKNAGIQVTVSHATPGNTPSTQFDIVNGLLGKGFLFIRMDIENLSHTIQITYNPALTSLSTDALDYMKPLDYTDFYDFVKNDADPGKSLAALSTVIYDNTQTIKPGEKVVKFLIFPPPSKQFATADLDIKDMYIGTKSLDIFFPFALKELKIPLP